MIKLSKHLKMKLGLKWTIDQGLPRFKSERTRLKDLTSEMKQPDLVAELNEPKIFQNKEGLKWLLIKIVGNFRNVEEKKNAPPIPIMAERATA